MSGGHEHSWPTHQIEPFAHYLITECGLSKNTLLSYRRDLKRFQQFCLAEHIDSPHDLTPVLLQGFARYLSRQRLSTASVARHLAALKMFLRYHLLCGLMKKDVFSVVESPKLWQRIPRIMSVDQTAALLEAIDKSSPFWQRDRAVLELLYATGMRASEAACLRISDLNLQIGYIRCFGKGNKERVVPINQTDTAALEEYLRDIRPNLAGEKHPEELFLSRTGHPLDRIDIWRIVKRAQRRAGIVGKISPHTLRHCFGSHLLQGGADLRVVQEMLGHANVATTQIYTHVDSQHLRAMHKKYHPLG